MVVKGEIALELRVLRYFLTVADEGNITKAAEVLHVTQPTLSRQMTDLEEEVGVRLMIRGKRALKLTGEGLVFKQQAENILKLADQLEHAFSEGKDIPGGVIKIGASESAGSRALAGCMKRFTERYPLVQFDLYNGMADDIKEMVERGELDLGLVLEPIDTSKFEYITLPSKEVWGILVPKDHILASQKVITVDDIKKYGLIMPKREKALSHVLNWMGCRETDLEIRTYYNILSNAALLVEAGMGCAVCLEGALSVHSSPDICFRQVLPKHVSRSVILWKKKRAVSNGIADLFIQAVHMDFSGNVRHAEDSFQRESANFRGGVQWLRHISGE